MRQTLSRQGFAEDRIEVQQFLNCRYQGTDSALFTRKPEDGFDFAKAFAENYKVRRWLLAAPDPVCPRTVAEP